MGRKYGICPEWLPFYVRWWGKGNSNYLSLLQLTCPQYVYHLVRQLHFYHIFNGMYVQTSIKHGRGTRGSDNPPLRYKKAEIQKDFSFNFSWWRRGRVELPVQKKVASTSTGIVCSFISPAQPLQAEFKRASRLVLNSPYQHRDYCTPAFRRPIQSHRDEERLDERPFRLLLELLRWQLIFAT